jgi:hypothetical protein
MILADLLHKELREPDKKPGVYLCTYRISHHMWRDSRHIQLVYHHQIWVTVPPEPLELVIGSNLLTYLFFCLYLGLGLR